MHFPRFRKCNPSCRNFFTDLLSCTPSTSTLLTALLPVPAALLPSCTCKLVNKVVLDSPAPGYTTAKHAVFSLLATSSYFTFSITDACCSSCCRTSSSCLSPSSSIHMRIVSHCSFSRPSSSSSSCTAWDFPTNSLSRD